MSARCSSVRRIPGVALYFASISKQGVYIRLDADVLDWLKSKGKGHQTRECDLHGLNAD